ncbi:winged helix-turn-helix domain-containing protein [Streptomyces sp. NBC_01497]|uniref:winged helix-turn-helix domain-containing protein n=1 Tax=Streptomyces sp. NBC_01497 TaxID=2903885 RepID=UPI003FCDA649
MRPVLCGEGIVLDPRARTAIKAGSELHLTRYEFDVLALLMRYPGHPLGKDFLLHRVWGGVTSGSSIVYVHVRRLRRKVERDPSRPRIIRTVWGTGYQFGESLPAGGGVSPPGDDPLFVSPHWVDGGPSSLVAPLR